MIYMHGQARDYERWASLTGDDTWRWDQVLPAFKRSFGALEIDARTTPFDEVVAASGKCLEGVPGMGFVIARRAALEASAGNSHSLAMASTRAS
jgi:choline dehydrogenase-like flavoprotein